MEKKLEAEERDREGPQRPGKSEQVLPGDDERDEHDELQ